MEPKQEFLPIVLLCLLNSFSYPVIKEVLNYHPLTLVSSSYSLTPLNNKWDAVLGRSAWKCTKQRHYVTNSLGPAILLTVNFTCRGMLCHKANSTDKIHWSRGHYSTNVSTKDKKNIRNIIFALIARVLLYYTYSI